MDLKIINGKVITHEKTFFADIGIVKGKIKHIGKVKKPAKETIDAKGKLIFPGVIDAHVHYNLKTDNGKTSENFSSGTKAAACGGVTTIIDFAVQEKGSSLSKAIKERQKEAKKVAIDYSLHAVPTDWNEKTKKEIKKVIGKGISSFKMYMIYKKTGLMSDDKALFGALKETRKHGGMVSVHAESSDALDLLIERYHNKKDMKRYGAYCHALSRPNFIEALAIQRAITWAQATKGTLYIVHMSTGEGYELVKDAQRRGVKVFAETCPHYLLLDDSVFKRKNGYLYATCPQVKKKSDSKKLWQGLKEGTISVIATDTCTFKKKDKSKWKGDFTKIPYGLPGVETLLPLMYTFGVGKKRISLNQLVKLTSLNPAKIFGLYPQKGTIKIGSDADLVIFDPKKKITLSHKNLHTNCDWSPYEGFKLKGYPTLTISRGKIVYKNGKFKGKIGHGKFVTRKEAINAKNRFYIINTL